MASATFDERRGSVRTGGRSARVRAAVHEATLLELGLRGYAALSIEDIAVRAGVHKTTIYRRWGTKDTLLAAAVGDLVDARVPVPDTGAIETDLREYARSIVDILTSDVGVIAVAVLFSDAARVPEVAEVKRNLFAERHRLAAPIVERAIQRGELPADTDPRELIGLVAAPIYYRLLVTGEPIDRAVGDRAALAALAAAPAVRPGR
ncbi:TetR/AcrR family transcriptional regulator [Actinacidiphila oryziradicis]|jgi:AcrR family transcriptional regulator|uniref:TetR/AcrR family transcriptional regulator n=1 Tax=Actinacidiphila oryziradicis TaxID=2571141 RepID=UPI0023EFC781|nr:TetR/AcrR family transcriptional regulator [Actinacidiphila oryziradicis]MCW2870677.1 TetR family transcriptional regulator [Actinacidiphila oryziradicis]